MSTRQVIGAVGAAVGGFFFGPQGAQWGWAIGSVVGGAIDPEIIKGPSVGDIAAQTSQEGIPRPIVFAVSQPIAGNIIATQEPRIVKKRKRQGKGGPKVETETVFRTYAIGVCEGPITRFVRVWRNGQLVYDAEDPVLDETTTLSVLGVTINIPGQNNKFLARARFFLGEYTQNASPDLEAIFGVGTTPAHRGTAYMVMADEDLTDMRGAIPQYQFQVERCEGTFLTSRPYPIEEFDAVDSRGDFSRDVPAYVLTEAIDPSVSIVSGELRALLQSYTNWPTEAVNDSASIVSGELDTILITYTNWPTEAVNDSASIVSGDLDTILITYTNWPTEAVNSSGSLVSGSLT